MTLELVSSSVTYASAQEACKLTGRLLRIDSIEKREYVRAFLQASPGKKTRLTLYVEVRRII